MGKKQNAPEGLLEFEAAMREAGRPARLIWVQQGPRGLGVAEHGVYQCEGFEDPAVYVQAFEGGGWKAFVSVCGPRTEAVWRDILRLAQSLQEDEK